MRKIALLAAVAGVVAVGSISKADFVYQIVRGATITSGPLTGDQLVDLQIMQNSSTALQSGNVSNYAAVTMTSPTANAFVIRTWDGSSGYNNTAPSANTFADFGNQGAYNDDSTLRGNAASYVRLGTDSFANFAKYAPLAFLPLENSQTYTDYQSVGTFSVDAGEGTAGYAVPSFTTLAQAAVPAGTTVTFTGTVYATVAGSAPSGFQLTDPAPVPEPTSLTLAGIGAAGLLARRRRA